MSLLSQQIASKKFRKTFLVFVVSLAGFLALEAISFLAGIYQLETFLRIAVLIYLFIIAFISFTFDLRLKPPGSLRRSRYYYQYSKSRFSKLFKIIARSLALRFHYLKSWPHWRHFQNYLILPSVLYWGVVLLIFLNPFSVFKKQFFVVVSACLFALIVGYLKFVFIGYSSTAVRVRYMMFAVTMITAFAFYASLLGVVWYLGLPDFYFTGAAALITFLLLYQSLFHHAQLNLEKNLKFAFLGSFIIWIASSAVWRYWALNYYTAGIILATVLHLYWSLTLQAIQKRLTWARAWEYILIFALLVVFALSMTNFHSRIS